MSILHSRRHRASFGIAELSGRTDLDLRAGCAPSNLNLPEKTVSYVSAYGILASLAYGLIPPVIDQASLARVSFTEQLAAASFAAWAHRR